MYKDVIYHTNAPKYIKNLLMIYNMLYEHNTQNTL